MKNPILYLLLLSWSINIGAQTIKPFEPIDTMRTDQFESDISEIRETVRPLAKLLDKYGIVKGKGQKFLEFAQEHEGETITTDFLVVEEMKMQLYIDRFHLFNTQIEASGHDIDKNRHAPKIIRGYFNKKLIAYFIITDDLISGYFRRKDYIINFEPCIYNTDAIDPSCTVVYKTTEMKPSDISHDEKSKETTGLDTDSLLEYIISDTSRNVRCGTIDVALTSDRPIWDYFKEKTEPTDEDFTLKLTIHFIVYNLIRSQAFFIDHDLMYNIWFKISQMYIISKSQTEFGITWDGRGDVYLDNYARWSDRHERRRKIKNDISILFSRLSVYRTIGLAWVDGAYRSGEKYSLIMNNVNFIADYATLAHEIGHLFSLNHVDSASCIMEPIAVTNSQLRWHSISIDSLTSFFDNHFNAGRIKRTCGMLMHPHAYVVLDDEGVLKTFRFSDYLDGDIVLFPTFSSSGGFIMMDYEGTITSNFLREELNISDRYVYITSNEPLHFNGHKFVSVNINNDNYLGIIGEPNMRNNTVSITLLDQQNNEQTEIEVDFFEQRIINVISNPHNYYIYDNNRIDMNVVEAVSFESYFGK